MSDIIDVCPECNLAGLRRRKPEHPCSTVDHQYYCSRCGATCDNPDQRERQAHGGIGDGLARELLEAEPGDLVTDGGTAQHPPVGVTDDSTPGQKAQAIHVCIVEENWERAEEGLLSLLGDVRKRKGGGSDD